MKKEFWFVIVLALLFCVGFFIYCVLTYEEEPKGAVFEGSKFEEPQYYELKETEEGRFLVNEHAGFSLMVPEGWKVEKVEAQSDEWIARLISPDAELDDSGFLKKGCGIGVWIKYDRFDYEDVLLDVQNPRKMSEYVKYEKIEIGKIPALEIVGESEKIGKILFIKIPYKENTVLFLDTRIIPEYSYCEDIFNQIIQSIKFLES